MFDEENIKNLTSSFNNIYSTGELPNVATISFRHNTKKNYQPVNAMITD